MQIEFSDRAFVEADKAGNGTNALISETEKPQAKRPAQKDVIDEAKDEKKTNNIKDVSIVDDDLVKVVFDGETAYYYPPASNGRLVKSERNSGTFHFVWSEDGTLERYVRPDGSLLKFSINDNEWIELDSQADKTGFTYKTFGVQNLETGTVIQKEGPITSADLALGKTFELARDNRGAVAYRAVSSATWESAGLLAISKFDKDGNAYLDLDEIDEAINNSAKQYLSSNEEQFLYSARKNFDLVCDRDHSPGISKSDVNSIAQGLLLREKEQWIEKYKVDSNKDGFVSIPELESISKKLRTKEDVQTFRALFNDTTMVGGEMNKSLYESGIEAFGRDNSGNRRIDNLAGSNEMIALIKSNSQKSETEKAMNIEPADIKQADIGNCPIMASLLGLSLTSNGKEYLKQLVHYRNDGKIEVKFPGFRPVVLDRPGASLFAMVTPSSNIAVWAIQQAAGILNQETNDNASIKSVKIPALATNNPERNMPQIGPHQLLIGDTKSDLVGIDGGATPVGELDQKMSEIQNKSPLIWTIGTGARLTADFANSEYKDKNWNHLGEEERKKLLANQGENPANYPGIEKLLNGHAYTVERYDAETKMVRLRNPHDGGAFFDIPLATLKRAFSEGSYSLQP